MKNVNNYRWPNKQQLFVGECIQEYAPKNILYVGMRPNTDKTLFNYCKDNNISVEVLEAWPSNCVYVRTLAYVSKTYELDVRNIDTLNANWDGIIWLHGPEHIPAQDLESTLNKLRTKAKSFILLQAPIGDFPQDPIKGNPFELHQQALLPEAFEKFGYVCVKHDKAGECTFSALLKV